MRGAIVAIAGLSAFLFSAGCASLTKKVARDATPEAINSGIQAGVSEENQEAIVNSIEPDRIEQATEQVAAATTDGWTQAMASQDRQADITQAIAPIVAALVDQSVDRALSDEHLARIRELAKQATLGFQDAIDEVSKKQESGEIPSDEGNVLEAVDNLAEEGGKTLYVVGAIAALLALLLALAVAWGFRRRRRYERELGRRNEALEAAMRLLAQHGMPFKAAPTAADSDPGETADAELVRSALQQGNAAQQGNAVQRGIATEQGSATQQGNGMHRT